MHQLKDSIINYKTEVISWLLKFAICIYFNRLSKILNFVFNKPSKNLNFSKLIDTCHIEI